MESLAFKHEWLLDKIVASRLRDDNAEDSVEVNKFVQERQI